MKNNQQNLPANRMLVPNNAVQKKGTDLIGVFLPSICSAAIFP